jgi:hypothetical protein
MAQFERFVEEQPEREAEALQHLATHEAMLAKKEAEMMDTLAKVGAGAAVAVAEEAETMDTLLQVRHSRFYRIRRTSLGGNGTHPHPHHRPLRRTWTATASCRGRSTRWRRPTA